MQSAAADGTIHSPRVSTDIYFQCAKCHCQLVVDAAAAGLTLNCTQCGHPTPVPNPALETAAVNAVRISELQHQLKENESQRTEITSYINQLNIQLSRWQLRLQTLNQRQAELTSELVSLQGSARAA